MTLSDIVEKYCSGKRSFWEYTTERLGKDDLVFDLNEMAKDGWDLVMPLPRNVFVFRRRRWQ